MKDDIAYVRHIRECIRRIEENVAEGRDRFIESHALQDAVPRNLQTMSESTQHLSDALKAAHPENRVGTYHGISQRTCSQLSGY